MPSLTLDCPWMEFNLGTDHQVLSWAINRPGFVSADRILWREVRNADLPEDLDVETWLAQELENRNSSDAVTFLTSRDIRQHTQHIAQVGAISAHAVATVGLSNAERVGHRVDRSGYDWGTINVALHVDQPLTQTALLELLSITVQARTAAILDIALPLQSGDATGTGTDCVAVAAPKGSTQYAGLHTEVGEAAGHAVYQAALEGAQGWIRQYGTKAMPKAC